MASPIIGIQSPITQVAWRKSDNGTSTGGSF